MAGDDLAALVAELLGLYRALAHVTASQPQDDRSLAGPPVAAALTATTPASDGRRSVPGSRPPVSLDARAAQDDIREAVMSLCDGLRTALGHTTRDRWPQGAGELPGLYDATPRTWRGERWLRAGLEELERARRRARRVLDLDPRLVELGPCPEIHQNTVPVAWDTGGRAVAYVDVRECVAYDLVASAKATRARAADHRRALSNGARPADIGLDGPGPVDIWRRSHLVTDPAAGTTSPDGDIRCPVCRRRWAGEQGRAELARLMGVDLRETEAAS